MEYPTIGKTYRIRHNQTGKYFARQGDWSDKSGAAEVAFYETDHELHRYMWAYVGNGSGQMLFLKEAGGAIFIGLVRPPGIAPEEATFELVAEGESFYIRHPELDKYIGYDSGKISTEGGKGGNLFSLEEVDSWAAVVKVGRVVEHIPPTPELASYNQPPEYQPSPEVLTGISAVPFFFVKKDADHGGEWQAKNSPYYIIERRSRWHRIAWEVFPRGKTDEHFWSTTEGVEEDEVTEIDNSLNISVTANAGFSFEGLSAGVSTTVGTSLNIKHTTGIKKTYSHYTSDRKTVGPYDQDVAIGDWYLQDHYRIYRADGSTVVQDFTVTVPETHAGRTFPPKKELMFSGS